MTIGEPRHPLPDFVAATVAAHAARVRPLPARTTARPSSARAIAAWLARRYGVAVDPDTQIVPLNGTREGLFNAALALSPESRRAAPGPPC